ncbi:MAG: HEAT repeat domain-containing protein [Sporanaerobacter sp.]|jgi:HEAT repeat protein|uniref:HEAT repeat domain-containing protein n=1 Tax=Sporanaerobacter sp. TaxID=2010183 RepID=UPI003A102A0B
MYEDLWKNISNIEDHYISYFLYKEGKSLETIAIIRRMSKEEVEKDIIRCKIEQANKDNKKEDELIKIISLPKKERLCYLNGMTDEEKELLSKDIYKRYIKFKNPEDRMILIWLIGELKDERLIPFLKMELNSKNVNYRRLSCSALGKINKKETKSLLEEKLKDENPQVRQYAIKALSSIGDDETIELLKRISLNDEKGYVRRNALDTIDKIRNNI